MADGFSPLALTPAIEAATRPIWDKVRSRVTPLEWRTHAPLIAAINALKAEKNAVILAHNYMTPEIFHGVGDYVGDAMVDFRRHVVVGEDDGVALSLEA